MSEQSSQEPTMEEILASIRRIISEDDAPPEAEDAAPVADVEAEEEAPPPVAAAPEPEPEAEPEAPPPAPIEVEAAAPPPVLEEDEDLELTEKVETLGDLDVYEAEPAPVKAPPPPVEAPVMAEAVAGLVSASAATAAAASFGQLSATLAMPRSDRTLEDVVRELLRPMLQQWLDDNLPGIVQAAVETEVERIARGASR